ncbi:hypothetical protein SAMN05518672_115103 [Chitinophaga sp. CF118]|uniref:hypothetical protein n=1 Tax=Chitinophaga sp. CF118 TaxID=1884367 RepID=UPI0008E073B7|nr:hypothetical protein [Chitinophaga sp. CF118]SFF07987.1 hypothetical protein SAMN05518672_115103 [Chitinophaga sp. CF118]
MHLSFSDVLPGDLNLDPILISGSDSFRLNQEEYLILREENNVTVFKIKYEYHCSPFKQARVIGNFLLIGHENHFYMFDLLQRMNVLTMEMKGYFGHLYVENNLCYVTDANGLYCIESKGKILWENGNLGIDGVIINRFDEDKIYGEGEWNPPGGWHNFTLEKKTGRLLLTSKQNGNNQA